ncbi:MAG: hypothetical protein EA405_06020 [Rhodospirillales bacterium]|nr:MAG: hypothetical protein EA405_06020 [Rhodospirillales bacterium]
MTLVFVDVDGTLIAPPGSEPAFILHLFRSGTLRARQLLAVGAFMGRYSRQFGAQTFKKNKAYLAGLKVGAVAALAAEFVVRTIRPRLRHWMLDRLAEHRCRGDRLILLTGTPDFIAAAIGRLVGADRIYASRCAETGGRFVAAPPLQHPFGPEKVAAAASICRQLGVPLHRCVAYADAVDDVPLLTRVGHPVAVCPAPGLRRVAMACNWEILEDPVTARVAALDACGLLPTQRRRSHGGRRFGAD